MLANGLQGTLLSLRATLEGFATTTTGLVMSGYFAGIILGSWHTPSLVRRVGHIRVFAALASIASIAILVHALMVDTVLWTVMRVVTGFSYAGMYVVAESWLNDRATNESRGQVLSLYTVVVFAGAGAGQLLLNVGDPRGVVLFILTSILVSLALVPILLTARPAPAFHIARKVGVMELARIAPLPMFSALATGVAHGAIFGMGAVYGQQSGFTVLQISWFMATLLLGGIVCQWPIGRLSDRMDRRWVLLATGAGALLVALAAVAATEFRSLLILAFLIGATALPLYSLSIAAANDRLDQEQMVGASATLVLVSGIGLMLGPISASIIMGMAGPKGYFIALALAFAAIVAGASIPVRRHERVAPEDQATYVMTAQRGSPVSVAAAAEVAHGQPNPQESGLGAPAEISSSAEASAAQASVR
jgi:MFS family permease